MVNLSTTYDTDLHKKVFVLKGEEGYARTTDVVASLVEFADSDNYITNARYGLKIQVLRNIDDSSIAIFDNDQLLKLNDGSTLENIPWYETMSQATCPSGCTWNDDGTMTIGLEMDDDDPTDAYLQTGLALNYDVEHNIVVRYLGNSSCLKSKSRTITKTIAFPSAFITKFTLEAVDSTANAYNLSQTPVIKGVLTDGEDNPLQSKTVKVYEDGVLVATNTTGNDGSYSYTTNGLANGLHTYRFVFDGVDNEFYACEKSINISYGYNIVGDSPNLWVNGIGYINATVTDYFNNPISGLSLSCIVDGTNTITGTTGSLGTAILSNETQGLDISSTLTITDTYGDASDDVGIELINLTSYDINGTTTETWVNGSTLPLTVSATGTDSGGTATSVEGLVVALTNATPSTVTLDSNGQATCYYAPTGAGDVTVTANFQDAVTDTVGITDYHTVWANSQIYNGYSTMSYCYRQILSTGWYLRSNSSSSASKLYWYKRNGVQFDSFWASFDVVGVDSDTTSINVCGASITVSAGSTVAFRRTLNPLQDLYLVYVWVDGSFVNNISYEGTPYVGFNSASNKGFTFNNLKIKTL